MGVYIVLSYFVMFFWCAKQMIVEREFAKPIKWFIFSPIMFAFVVGMWVGDFLGWLLKD